jgi:hypothetical protein
MKQTKRFLVIMLLLVTQYSFAAFPIADKIKVVDTNQIVSSNTLNFKSESVSRIPTRLKQSNLQKRLLSKVINHGHDRCLATKVGLIIMALGALGLCGSLLMLISSVKSGSNIIDASAVIFVISLFVLLIGGVISLIGALVDALS